MNRGNWRAIDPAAPRDPGRTWLRAAMLALAVLAVVAGVVSFNAQFRMIDAAKNSTAIAGLEAVIPDTAAVIFAALAIALAMRGKRAIRARLLNLAAVATSVGMNALAASAGWRSLAIWAMPSIAYALASDTLIGVLRSAAIARARELNPDLAEERVTPLTVVAGIAFWTLRLVMAPVSTLSGFRRWVVDECPVAPGRRARPVARRAAVPPGPRPERAAVPPVPPPSVPPVPPRQSVPPRAPERAIAPPTRPAPVPREVVASAEAYSEAVKVYEASVEAGTPLSARQLADATGLSRRQTGKIVSAADAIREARAGRPGPVLEGSAR
jgi:hypothetical protein